MKFTIRVTIPFTHIIDQITFVALCILQTYKISCILSVLILFSIFLFLCRHVVKTPLFPTLLIRSLLELSCFSSTFLKNVKSSFWPSCYLFTSLLQMFSHFQTQKNFKTFLTSSIIFKRFVIQMLFICLGIALMWFMITVTRLKI